MRKPRGLCLRGGVGKPGGERVHLAPNALGRASVRILRQLLAHVAQNQGCDGCTGGAEGEHQVEEQVVVHAAILQALAAFRAHQLPITNAYQAQKKRPSEGAFFYSWLTSTRSSDAPTKQSEAVAKSSESLFMRNSQFLKRASSTFAKAFPRMKVAKPLSSAVAKLMKLSYDDLDSGPTVIFDGRGFFVFVVIATGMER